MTKILDTNYINGPIPKYIELRKGVLINGQYHLKDTMQPVPFAQYIINNPNIVNVNSYTFLDRKINHADVSICNSLPIQNVTSIVYDSENENVSYVWFHSGTFAYLYKYDESNNNCKTTGGRIFINNEATTFCVEFCEKDNNIVLSLSGSASVYGRITRYVLSKENNLATISSIEAVTSINTSSYPYTQSCNPVENLYMSSQSAVFDYSYYSEANNSVIKEKVIHLCSAGSLFKLTIHNVYENTNDKLKVLSPIPNANGGGFYKEFVMSTFDKNLEKWNTQKVIPVVGGDKSLLGTGSTTFQEMFIKTFGSRTFIVVYERTTIIGHARANVFEITKDENGEEVITFIKAQTMPSGQGGAIIHHKDEEKLKFYGTCKNGTALADLFSSVYCYEFNETTLEFEKTMSIDGLIRDFGFDKERNLYVTWSDMSMDKYNTRTVANFNAKFEEGLYEYQGVDINTNLIVSTANLQGELLAKEVKLEMKGNAKFKATDNKSISVTTLTTGDLKIPVVITGAGSLNIFPKVKA